MPKPHVMICVISLCLLFACGGGAGNSQPAPAPVPLPQPSPTQPPPPSPQEAARPLSSTGQANLVAFARLYSYVRFFHPSDEAQKVPWDAFASEGARQVEGAATPAELQTTLLALFSPYAPTVQVFPETDNPDLPATLRPSDSNGLALAYWEHLGLGGLSEMGTGIYQSVRKTCLPAQLPANRCRPDQPYEAPLGSGLRCRVPLTLYRGADGTLPWASAKPIPLPVTGNGNDRGTRLGNLITTWSILQHFWAYAEEAPRDWAGWEGAFRSALNEAARLEGETTFREILQKMVATLHDGHGWVNGPYPVQKVPPFWIAWIEDQWVVVSRETMCPEDIQVGDVLVSMDGRAMADIESEASLMVPAATPQGLKFNLPGVLLNKNVDSAQLVIQKPNGELRSLLVPWNGQTPYGTYPEPRPASPLTELKPGIWYLDLDRITDLSKLQAVISQLAQAKGLVIDMRGYPTWGVWRELFGHLSANAMTSIPFIIPTPTRPDHPSEFTSYFTNTLPVSAPTFSAKVVFLTDGRAISQAEFVMAMAAGYHLGEIVGESTAGTDGNINPFDLPGGYSVWWTGMEVRNVDGSKHFQVGIQPTVPCQRTLAGMRAGKDELLEKALSLLP